MMALVQNDEIQKISSPTIRSIKSTSFNTPLSLSISNIIIDLINPIKEVSLSIIDGVSVYKISIDNAINIISSLDGDITVKSFSDIKGSKLNNVYLFFKDLSSQYVYFLKEEELFLTDNEQILSD